MAKSTLVLVYIIIIALPALFLFLAYKVNWAASNFRFNIKKLMDCVVYSLMFIFLVCTHYVMIRFEWPVSVIVIPVIECILCSLYLLHTFTSQFSFFSKSESPFNPRVFPLILVSLSIGVLMALSTINYAFYMLWPNFYEIPSELSYAETAFEFVYYSFTLAVTYSSGSIAAVHVVTKLAQIVEICYCYILVGNIIVQLIEKMRSHTRLP